jgi:flavodoxin
MAYEPLWELAKQEQKDGLLPEFQGELKNIDQYKTVLIGGPVWWGTYPQVMFTFFKKYDLSGKTLIPFTTHEGSGLGRCAEDVRKAYPKAEVKGEFAIYGHEVRGGKKQVAKCVYAIGRNWAWWNDHSPEEKKKNRHYLKEMSEFLKANTAFFGDPSWHVSLRCTACLGKFPNRVSTSIAMAMNRRTQKLNNTRFFAS